MSKEKMLAIVNFLFGVIAILIGVAEIYSLNALDDLYIDFNSQRSPQLVLGYFAIAITFIAGFTNLFFALRNFSAKKKLDIKPSVYALLFFAIVMFVSLGLVLLPAYMFIYQLGQFVE